MKVLYNVTLTREERDHLRKLISSGKGSARRLLHARILLKADTSSGQPKVADQAIAQMLECGSATILRVRRRFVEAGLTAALEPRYAERHHTPKLDGEQEAHLIALLCGPPPCGYQRWSLRLLADKLVELHYVDSVSHETVRQVLKKTNSSRGANRSGASHRKRRVTLSTTWKTS
jgi:transposase